MTWAEFDATVDRASRGLLALGFETGDHFGVWATNVPEWLILQFATARIGVVLVNINPAYRTSELKYALRQSDVRGLALIDTYKSSQYFDMINEACPELAAAAPGELQSETFPKLKWVVSLRGGTPPGMLSWDELLAKGEGVSQQRLDEVAAGLSPHDPINIQYTSGTTGIPEGGDARRIATLLLNAYYVGRPAAVHRAGSRSACRCRFITASAACWARWCASSTARRWSSRPSVRPAAPRSTAIGRTSVHGALRRADDVHRRAGAPAISASATCQSLRTGDHGRQPVPDRGDAARHRQMGAREITIGYGQTEASPIITQTRDRRPLELPRRHGRPAAARRRGARSSMPGPARTLPATASRRALRPRPRRHDRLLQQAGRRPPRRSTPTAGCTPATSALRDAERLLPHHRPLQGHDHPRRREHLPARDRGVPVPAPGRGRSAGRRPARSSTTARKCWRGSSSRRARATEDEIARFCRRPGPFQSAAVLEVRGCFPQTVTGKIQKFKIREQAIQELGLQDAAKIETA